MSKYIAVLSVVLSVAGFAAPTRAQNAEVRDAAIARCMGMAQKQYPQDTAENQGGRIATYKLCMEAAGFHP